MRFSPALWIVLVALSVGLGPGSATSAFGDPAAAPRAVAAPAPAPAAKLPDPSAMLVLVRSTILALDQAIRTGNYTVLRDLSAPQFQQLNSAARLSALFASLAGKSPNLSRVAVLTPQYTQPPAIGPKGNLHVAGIFPTAPEKIQFELLFAWSNGQWRFVSIGVGLHP